jgi:hypothetical protein
MTLYPQSATSQEPTLTPSPSILFTLGLAVESIKELGGASNDPSILIGLHNG